MSAAAGVEATIDALITKLGAELPAKIAAINAETADEYQLVAPTSITFGPRSEQTFPWIAVVPQTTELLADASGRIHYRHLVSITSWQQSWDQSALVRLLIRQQRAVREVALHYRRPDQGYTDLGAGYGLQFVEDDYGPVFESDSAGASGSPDGSVFTSYATSIFAVEQQQDL